MTRFLTIILFVFTASNSLAEETFNFIGSFDNVKATETGHCYGEGIDLWELESKKIIGLLHIAQGLCGDPACSSIEGEIEGDIISFKTLKPIYNQAYTFKGSIVNYTLNDLLNDTKADLKKDSRSQRHKNKSEWCATWSNISRCKGVENVCN